MKSTLVWLFVFALVSLAPFSINAPMPVFADDENSTSSIVAQADSLVDQANDIKASVGKFGEDVAAIEARLDKMEEAIAEIREEVKKAKEDVGLEDSMGFFGACWYYTGGLAGRGVAGAWNWCFSGDDEDEAEPDTLAKTKS